MSWEQWLDGTLALQREAFGVDPPSLEGDELADYILWNALALHDEVSEMLQEVGWKPWTQPRGWVNRDAMIGEVVDQLHFIANILVTVGCTGSELQQRYTEKVAKNRARQLGGDDGVSRRCPRCRRSLDDVGGICPCGADC